MKTKHPAGCSWLAAATDLANDIDGPLGSADSRDWLKVIAHALISIAESQAVIAASHVDIADSQASIANSAFDIHGELAEIHATQEGDNA